MERKNGSHFSEVHLQAKCIVLPWAKWITYHMEPLSMCHLTFVHCAPRSMKYRRMRPIKAAWEPAVALPCHWEWTVGLALIGREPESHLHLGQAALALNPHAPPFLPLGSSSARLPALLQRAAAEMSFTPTDAWRRGRTHSQPAQTRHRRKESTPTSPTHSLAEKTRLNFSQSNPAD